MAEKSGIEWTDASWNPTTGCTKISAGCLNCYAEKLSLRLKRMGSKKYANGFDLTLHHNALRLPFKWKKSKRIFVNSMSDLFHKDVPFDFVDEVWNVMMEADWHTYQILTKRPERMAEHIDSRKILNPPHIWLGTSVENAWVKTRIKILQGIPNCVRFISFEPLIGEVGNLDLSGIKWVIVGGESGEGHRPIEEDWVLEIMKQCREHKTAFFFKQWGGQTPKSGGNSLQGKTYQEFPI